MLSHLLPVQQGRQCDRACTHACGEADANGQPCPGGSLCDPMWGNILQFALPMGLYSALDRSELQDERINGDMYNAFTPCKTESSGHGRGLLLHLTNQ